MREFLLAIDKFSLYLAERQRDASWTNLPIADYTRESLTSSYAASDPPYVDKMSCTITTQESTQ
jgi:hypothetical protein